MEIEVLGSDNEANNDEGYESNEGKKKYRSFIGKNDIKIEGEKVSVTMTLTAPNCPIADEVVEQVRNGVWAVKGVQDVDVQLVFEPEWTPERMSEEARLMLNMY